VVQPAGTPQSDRVATPMPQVERTPPARAPEQASAPWTTRAVVRRVAVAVTAVGVFAAGLLAYEFLLSWIPEAKAQTELLATYKQSVPTTTLDRPSTAPAAGSPVALMRLPGSTAGAVVVEGSSPSELKMGPAHLSASPLPGEYGNSVIAGRRTTYGSPFGRLDRLRKGDVITVATGQGVFRYKVTKLTHVDAGQPDVVAGSRSSQLTLVTSDPAFVATGRLAVIATLQGKPIAVPTRPAVLLDPAQLGLTGDPLGLALGVLWLNLLVVAAFLTWRWRRRVPRSVLYLFAAPVLAALALLTFANLDSLLPGTM